MSASRCIGPDCIRPSDQGCGGYCDSHYRQIRRGRELRPLRPYRRAADTLYAAAIGYATAMSAEEHQRATQRLRAAAHRYVDSVGGAA